jgi:hypothetical protein
MLVAELYKQKMRISQKIQIKNKKAFDDWM